MLFSEPKIPQSVGSILSRRRSTEFQCSSASRKFLNQARRVRLDIRDLFRFQCSSASRKFLNVRGIRHRSRRQGVSVLFSEPKIPQYRFPLRALKAVYEVSVLFSEPKIPQYVVFGRDGRLLYRFQCSSASRKFLNRHRDATVVSVPEFQCSSASRKFLNRNLQCLYRSNISVSVLFSEPKIPQSFKLYDPRCQKLKVSVLFSEPKIPQSRTKLLLPC